ncbi:MAG TPA: hypothetical protein VMR66_10985 [Gemmatimonadota bacterium]|nr:hypothetical protein [Gemmatimonadota bacterium]
MGRMNHLEPETLAAYQDDGLTSVERENARAHLGECALCRDRLGAQVRAAAGREAGAPRDRSVVREHLAAAAIGALLLGAGLWWALDRAPADRAAAPRARETSPVTPIPGDPPADEVVADPPGARSGAGDPAPRPRADEVEPELLALRGGAREADGKTFRLQGDEWVDDAWTASPARPPITLIRGTTAWRAALDERPALARYAEVGPRVLVAMDSLSFRILPAP